MTVARTTHCWAAVVLLLGSGLPAALADQSDRGKEYMQSARACERRGEWLEAYWWYDALLKIDRTDRQARQGLERCLRRCHLMRRHRDPAYRDALGRLTPSQAMDLYEQVLQTVSSLYLDRSRVSLDLLVEQGVREVRLALEDSSFVETYFPGVPADSIKALRDRLAAWSRPSVTSAREARTQVFKIVQAASQETGVPPSPLLAAVVALELANGACNSLDRYTLFLTPGDRNDWEASAAGKAIGVGLELAVVDQKVFVTRVYPKSPAQEVGLLPNDRILAINRQPVEQLTVEMILEKLAGEANTFVEVEVISPGQPMPQVVKMVRRPVVVPSVDHRLLNDTVDEEPIGLLRISRFQESTVQEVKEALAQLQTVGIRGLVIDLRDNPGGLFDAAVQVAELFLDEGVVVYTEGRAPYFTRSYRVEGMHPFALPVVVLIDGQTASAAEVFAGALKDNGRAYLMGQTTHGKGTMQRTVAIECTSNLAPGVRLTVARVLSPGRQPYHDRGVSPHEYLDPLSIDPLTAGKLHLQTLLRMMMR